MVSNLKQKQVAAHFARFILQMYLFMLSQRITTEMSFMGEILHVYSGELCSRCGLSSETIACTNNSRGQQLKHVKGVRWGSH